MAVRMKDLLDRFASMQKAAEETLAAQPGALVGVNDLPGSEHDAKVPAEAKKPNPEVTQGQPAGATTAEGAVNGGDAKPLNDGKLEVDQPLENPVKKPEITADALTAKEASAHLGKLVDELLSDISAGKAQAQKQAAAASATTTAPAQTKTEGQEKAAQDGQAAPAKSEGEAKPAEQKEGEKTATAKTESPKIELNDEMLSKLAAAVATFNAGRKAAEAAIQKAAADKTDAAKQAEKPAGQVEKTAAEKRMAAIRIIKEACVKAAQEAGLNPAAADAAAAAAMSDAGVSAEDAAAAQVDAGAAAADAGAAGAGDVQIPDDVTEEEVAKAIFDCVQTGELDVDTAKALVDELAGDAGGITEDQAAEAIADGLQSGEITPEQAQELIATIEGGAGDAGAAGGEAAAAGAEAAGAADAAQAAQDAADEAKGAADAEAAVKQAAAALRDNAIQKVASAIVAKREQIKQAAAQQTQSAQPKVSPLTEKVASILNARKAALDAQAAQAANTPAEKTASEKTEGQKYLEGFCKKAAELGVDPQKLAQYMLATKAQAQTK